MRRCKPARWKTLAACAARPAAVSTTDAATKTQGMFKIGQPYQVNGTWYYPSPDLNYDETGIASWYGKEFHEGTTANGEIFNKNELTAAHKTLPLPTLARVTNLDNGRSIVVRINDRGPFSGARIIDVSQRAAQLLGFEQIGTAKVRVQVLADESKAIADAMQHYGTAPPPVVAASATPEAPPPQTGQTAPIAPVMAAALSEPSPESAHLEPTTTTPQVHQQLLAIEPVPQVIQLPVAASHQIYVQVGAFTVPENATKLQQTISGLGQTSVVSANVNGTTFYRVRLGPLHNVTSADAMVAKARNAGYVNARTVVD